MAEAVNTSGEDSFPVSTGSDEQEGSCGSQDTAALVEVRTSDNRLRAEARVVPSPNGVMPGPEAVREMLRSYGVVFGIDEEALGSLLLHKVAPEWVLVGRGKAPKHGENARLEVLVNMKRSGPQQVQDSGGQVDMKDLGLIYNVEKDGIIARKIPATKGEDGIDVMGEPVKGKDGQDVKLLAGPNTELSEDRLTLTSLSGGHLIREGNKFQVKSIFEVHGDVDYSTGNLLCYGGIKVHGAVKEGFRLDAKGPVEVIGVVEGAEIVTLNDIIARGSVRGMGRGALAAGGSIMAVYIDQCQVSAQNDLVFQKALMHNRIKVGGCVRAVAGNRGVITGGTLEVGMEVECQTLGNEMGTKTEIAVGFPPELAEKRDKLKADMECLEKKKAMVEKNLVYLGKVIRRDGVNSARRAQVEKFMKLRDVILRQMEIGEKGKRSIAKAIDDMKHKSCVKVHGVCYPGVCISIRGATYILRESMQDVCFVYEKGAVTPMPLG